MKSAPFCAWLLVFHGEFLTGQEPDPLVRNKELYGNAYKLGVAEADEELNAGNATIYQYGLVDMMTLELLDRRTGLPLYGIAGCKVDDAIIGRAEGHNHRIDEVIAKRGLPSNSFKPWEKELFDLKGCYQTRSKTEKSFRLALGGPPAKSPDGKCTLRLVKTQLEVEPR